MSPAILAMLLALADPAADVRLALRRLASPRYATREAATLRLAAHGRRDGRLLAAVARGATRARDAEARWRCLRVLRLARPCRSCEGRGRFPDPDPDVDAPGPRPCPRCRGAGTDYWTAAAARRMDRCNFCGGSGFVPRPRRRDWRKPECDLCGGTGLVPGPGEEKP